MGNILAALPYLAAIRVFLSDHVHCISTYADNGLTTLFAGWMVLWIQWRERTVVVFEVDDYLDSVERLPSHSFRIVFYKLVNLPHDA